MTDPFFNKTIALAGMIQSITTVKELAQSGKLIEHTYEPLIYSLFQTAPNDVIEVYGGLKGIQFGLEKLVQIFGNSRMDAIRHLLKYLFSLLYLQKRIARSPKLLNQLQQRMKQMEKQVAYFHLMHPTVIENLSDIYLNTAGKFRFRMIIWGHSRSLAADTNLNKIRALLLAGIRSAFLWHQLGGSVLHLLFHRKKIRETAEKILAQMKTTGVK